MNNTWVEQLAQRHRAAGVLLDANLLILWIVGTVDPTLVGKHRKLTSYRKAHFDVLRWVVGHFTQVVTTPQVLAEASNMAMETKPLARGKVMAALAQVVQKLSERYETSQSLCAMQEFVKLGLADSSVVRLGQENVLVLTDDNELYGELERAGCGVVSIRRIAAA